MEFKDIVHKRYATKQFDGRAVPDSAIQELKEYIRLSASSFNLQPWKIKVISDAPTKAALSPASWDQPQITTCSHLFVICADTQVEALAQRLYAQMRAAGVPEANVEGFSKYVAPFLAKMNAEQRLVWAQKQCYIAMGNALNGAKALGLDSCPMEGFSPAEYSKILKLPDHLVPTIVVPVGYPADKARPKLRFESKDVFF